VKIGEGDTKLASFIFAGTIQAPIGATGSFFRLKHNRRTAGKSFLHRILAFYGLSVAFSSFLSACRLQKAAVCSIENFYRSILKSAIGRVMDITTSVLHLRL
jgi:hypothetical protein